MSQALSEPFIARVAHERESQFSNEDSVGSSLTDGSANSSEFDGDDSSASSESTDSSAGAYSWESDDESADYSSGSDVGDIDEDLDTDAVIAFIALQDGEIDPRAPKVRRTSAQMRASSHVDIEEYLRPSTSERLFWQVFRMRRATFDSLMSQVRTAPVFQPKPGKVRQASPEKQMLLFITHLVKGCTGKEMEETYGVPESSLHRYERRCIKALDTLTKTSSTWSDDVANLADLSEQFGEIHMMPGCVGIMDGTMIPIVSPPASQTTTNRAFYNYKSRYALGVQVLVDARGRIVSSFSGYCGSKHDSAALRQWEIFRSRDILEKNNFHFMADAGYPLRPWCLIPFDVKKLKTREQKRFNKFFCGRRCLVERVIGRLKGRFRILYHRSFILTLAKLRAIIGVCITLYNFCHDHGDHIPEEMEVPDRAETPGAGAYDEHGQFRDPGLQADVVNAPQAQTAERAALIETNAASARGLRLGKTKRERLVHMLNTDAYRAAYKKLPASLI
jgi:hypothetical protein